MSNLSFVVYTGDGGTGPYAVPFPYLDPSHLSVKVAGQTVAFSWVASASITLTAPAAVGAAIELRRVTPRSGPLVDFTDGSILTEADLDVSALQQIYIAQELVDLVQNSVTLGDDGHFTAASRRIADVAAPTATADAATKAYVDARTGADQAAAAAASASAAAGSASAAQTAQTAAEAAQAAAEAAVLPDGAVTQAKIADDAVGADQIADDAVGAAQLGLLSTKGDVLGYSTLPLRLAVGADDQVLTADSTAAAGVAWKDAGGGAFPPTGSADDSQTFNSSGTWTKPAGATLVRVKAWGGGGCGMTGHSGGANRGGDGGQGGGYVEVWLHPDDLGATETVTVGAGQASTTTVGKGGDSTFGSHVTAFGGAGGGYASSRTSPTPNAEAGAPGGTGSAATGRGAHGGSALNAGAGGGGGAYDGTNATSSGGASTNGGAGGDGADENTAATDGAQPGGGGGGGVRYTSSAHVQEYVGGDGGDGRIIVETWT